MDEVERLSAVAPPPSGVAPYTGWHELERRLGTRLPHDYKRLVDTYGSGSFGDFLAVLVPETRFPAVHLETQLVKAEESLASLRGTSVQVPFATGELLLIAKTDNMDAVYWVRRPPDDPDAWTIAILGRGMKWAEFEGGIADFLAAVLSGRFKVPFFPRFKKGVGFAGVPEPSGRRPG